MNFKQVRDYIVGLLKSIFPNIASLRKISESEDGNLLYDGEEIHGGGGGGEQVQADWWQSDSTQPDYIKHKPSIPTPDSYLSSNSNNPVANSVITNELKNVKSPTSVNIFNPTAVTKVYGGTLSCLKNSDGTYKINGSYAYNIAIKLGKIIDIPNGTYKIVGCPNGGSTNTYSLQVCTNNDSSVMGYDVGNGLIIDFDKEEHGDITISVSISSDVNLDNLVFKPMLTTNLDASYDNYVSYTGNELAINQTVSNINGKVTELLTTNLLKTSVLNKPSYDGVTITRNSDGSYTLNGTAEDEIRLSINQNGLPTDGKKYKLLGAPNWKCSLKIYGTTFIDEGEGIIFSTNEDHNILMTISSGETFNNVVVKPMITSNLNATIDDFIPYTGPSTNLNIDVAGLQTMKIDNEIIGKVWDNTEIYTVGEYVIHEKALFKCLIRNSGQNPWYEPTYWERCSVASAMKDLSSNSSIVISSTDITPGITPLETGKLYCVYE